MTVPSQASAHCSCRGYKAATVRCKRNSGHFLRQKVAYLRTSYTRQRQPTKFPTMKSVISFVALALAACVTASPAPAPATTTLHFGPGPVCSTNECGSLPGSLGPQDCCPGLTCAVSKCVSATSSATPTPTTSLHLGPGPVCSTTQCGGGAGSTGPQLCCPGLTCLLSIDIHHPEGVSAASSSRRSVSDNLSRPAFLPKVSAWGQELDDARAVFQVARIDT